MSENVFERLVERIARNAVYEFIEKTYHIDDDHIHIALCDLACEPRAVVRYDVVAYADHRPESDRKDFYIMQVVVSSTMTRVYPRTELTEI